MSTRKQIADPGEAEQAAAIEGIKNGPLKAAIERRGGDVDDGYIRRFLRARKWDLKAASTMLETHLAWYESFNGLGVEKIVAEVEADEKKQYAFLKEYYPKGILGVDKEGCPYTYVRVGVIDTKGLVGRVSQDIQLNYHVYLQESLRRARRAVDPAFTAGYGIVDITDLSFAGLYKPGLAVLKKIAAIDEAHYPESLKKLFVIHANKVFTVAFKIVKPWIDPITVQKMDVLGPAESFNAMNSVIDSAQIPEIWGGTGTMAVKPGGLISKDTDDTVQTAVSAGARHEAVFNVQSAGTTIMYEFWTEAHDIGFGIMLDDDFIEPSVRYDCAVSSGPTQATFTAKKPGTYKFVWDNSHSMLRKKNLSYRCFVSSDDEDGYVAE